MPLRNRSERRRAERSFGLAIGNKDRKDEDIVADRLFTTHTSSYSYPFSPKID